jgi:aspartate kinase
MKFGGTSVRDDESRAAAVAQIRRHHESGKRIVVVVSAMGRKGEPYATDTLIDLLREIGEPVSARELDLVMSCGETLSAAFFAHLLSKSKMPAIAFTGQQAGVVTDDAAGEAEILGVDPMLIRRALMQGKIAVVAGFQGADTDGEIRTLGRGGSDTSAVAIGAALEASVVEIYSDVDGIASADPRRVTEAPFMEEIGAEQILAMAEEGSRVIHPRAVKASLITQTPILARNTFSDAPGTLIHHRDIEGDLRPVALAHRENQVLLEIRSKKDPRKVVPDLLEVGQFRFLLLNDVYLAERLATLRTNFGDYELEDGWATASIILSHMEVSETPELDGAERMPIATGVWSYLVKEENLSSILDALFKRWLEVQPT